MSVSARELSVRVLDEVDRKRAYASRALDRVLSEAKTDARERSLATEIVYGTLRNRGYIDWVIDTMTPRGVDSIDTRLLNILRTAIYQIRFLTRIPPSAAVNEAVNLSKKLAGTRFHRFVNGLLRSYIRKMEDLVPPSPDDDPILGLSIAYSFPKWMIERWIAEYGFDYTVKLCEYFNATPDLTVRVNRLKADREAVADRLAKRGVEVSEAPHADSGLVLSGASAIPDIPEFAEGLFTVQSVSSMLVAPVVNPHEGGFVIDACAAPGGKTTHLAELMGDCGRVLALDIHDHRLESLRESASRLGLSCIETRVHDATVQLSEFDREADAVLIDAPCSGLGVLNRRPDARWRKTPDDIGQLVELQKSILKAMAQCVKPGGVLVYSTCTIVREENDDVIDWFLEANRDFRPSPIGDFLPTSLLALGGLRTTDDHSIRLSPPLHGIDGFYIARLVRLQ